MKNSNPKPYQLDTPTTYEQICQAVDDMGAKVLQFSIFRDNPEKENDQGDKWHVLAPDITSNNPVLTKPCKVLINYWRVSDEPVESPVLNEPTWKDLILATDQLLQNGDGCGVYLEGFRVHEEAKKVTVLEAVIGS